MAIAQSSASPIDVSAPQEAIPPNIISTSNKPMMMLVSSKDHTLFAPIYTDYEDVDGDGVLDTTFKPAFKYYGYFDSVKCYAYQNNRFEPTTKAIIKSNGAFTCPATAALWSGNFLNWATMSRVDVIRKMLYGGKRSTDGYADGSNQVSTTVLERVNLSIDAHSYVKHYFGQDIRDYTPFSTSDLTKTTGSNSNVYAGLTLCNRSSEMSYGGTPLIRLAKGNYSMWSTINGDVCRWKEEKHYWGIWGNAPYYMDMAGTFGPKLARYFLDTDKGNGGIAHEAELPTQATDGITYPGADGDLVARVKVCVPGLIEEEHCQAFPADSEKNLKPFGIFQEFGLGNSASAAARAEFGLITGSYAKNLDAGILRKNIGDFAEEINPSTGVFCHNSNAGCPATLTDGRKTGVGALKTLDLLGLFQRSRNEYDGSALQLPQDMVNGKLIAWGNPMGEMLVQALNYYAGLPSSNPTENLQEENYYQVTFADWKDPLSTENKSRTDLYGNPICRPMYTLALSSSALSFDANAGSNFQKLPNKKRSNLSDYVDLIGDQEKISNTQRSVGSVSGANTFGSTCSKKMVGKLSDVSGICPEAPGIGGSYQIAGASWYGNTSMVRDLASLGTLPSDFYTIKDALKVKTMAASLAGGVPRIEVPIPNQAGKYVYITPESVFNASGKMMPGGMLSFKSINSGPLLDGAQKKIGSFGSFVVSFNDKLFGGDYDMDVSGFLRYEVTQNPSNSAEYHIKIKTDIINVGGGYAAIYGFSIVGTDQDGRYLTHQHAMTYQEPDQPAYGYKDFKTNNIEGYLCADATAQPANTTPQGNRCFVSWWSDDVYNEDYTYEMNFKMLGVDNVVLQDPLWYAAKYGYFDSSKKNLDGSYPNLDLPENNAAWDSLIADGSRGTDGVPDGYFLARRPELLEAQLRKALNVLASTSNAAPAISTSVLADDTLKYTVSFDSTTVTGLLSASKLQANGAFSTTALWEAGSMLQAAAAKDQGDSRAIITNDGPIGTAFRWASLSPGYQGQMSTAGTNKLSAANAAIALAYIRGDQRQENGQGLRERGASLLGPVVNSSPWVQQRPMASWGDVAGYGDFYTTHRNRPYLLWLGANDGMLHAFKTDTGQEVMAYVPGALANRLGEIPLQRSGKTKLAGADFVTGMQVQPSGTVWPYVDGNPYSADVKVGDKWSTYVFGALGRGGRGVFALDATDVSKLTESQAASIFKWQFTAANDSDLGYQTGDVKIHLSSNQASPIVRLNNGKFAMLIGNGQRSLTGKAALFILYMDGPSVQGSWTGRYQKIVVDNGTENGLSTPHWEDLDGNGTADVVYAGDIKGNLWKFDLSSTEPGDWRSAYTATASSSSTTAAPLFTATTTQGATTVAQPITSAPEVIYMAQGGMLVTVGTGNAFSSGSFGLGSPRQSVYGVWDRGATVSPASILHRSYTRMADGTVVVNASASATLDWSKYQGWAIDLPADGEAVLTDPSYDAGVLSFVSTRPTTNTNQCTNLPANTLFMLDPISGLPERDTQGKVTVDGTKVLVAGKSIADPKVRVVTNRRAAPKVACQQGTAGCTCQGSDCTKEAPLCGAGQRSLSAVGKGADATICYSSAPRLHWRDISGLTTY